MLRKFGLLLLLLLAPCLAYSGNPTATFTLNATSGSGGGAAPGPAAAAGFTTLAFESDFSQPFYATKSNWIDCAGASSPQWWIGWRGTSQSGLDCSHYTQAVDPLDGSTVLRTTYSDTDYNSSTNDFGVFLQTTDLNNTPPLGAAFNFHYVEVVGRVDHYHAKHLNNFWSNSAGNQKLEFDGIEWSTNDSDSCSHNYNPNPPAGGGIFYGCPWLSGSPPTFPAMDFTQYHKYAWRVTSDGATESYFCAYIDDQQQNCVTYRANPSQITASSDGFPFSIQLFNSMGCGGVETPPACDTGAGTFNMYVKSVRGWACTGWNTGDKCFSGSPNP